jgi:hypothetical protein
VVDFPHHHQEKMKTGRRNLLVSAITFILESGVCFKGGGPSGRAIAAALQDAGARFSTQVVDFPRIRRRKKNEEASKLRNCQLCMLTRERLPEGEGWRLMESELWT